MQKHLLTALAFACTVAAMPVLASPGDVQFSTHIESNGTTTMVHEAVINAAPADVWTAISTAEGWMTWAVPIARSSSTDPDLLETSYNTTDKPGSPGTIQQRFLARVPGQMLAFRTSKVPAGFPYGEEYMKIGSMFELDPVGQQTKLKLTSAGYPDSPAGKELIAFFSKGNAMTLEALQKRFTDGPVDWKKQAGN